MIRQNRRCFMFDKQDNWSDWPSLHGKTVAMRKVADNEFRIVYVAAVDGGLVY